jgi:hypothetical protein
MSIEVVILFLYTNINNNAHANVFAAWLLQKPYIPPLYPFTICKKGASDGSCVGRKRSTMGLSIPLQIKSLSPTAKANANRMANPSFHERYRYIINPTNRR